MKSFLVFLRCVCLSAWFAVQAQAVCASPKADTVYVRSFGAEPNSFENSTAAIQAAIDACKQSGARVLAFAPGRYDLWQEGATRRAYYISNTSSESECPSKVKTIGMLFDGMKGLTIAGNGAQLVYHGKMTMLAFDRCEEMRVRDLTFDFERPGGSELTYVAHTDSMTTMRIHPDTRVVLVDGHVQLVGEGWRSRYVHCIAYNPENARFTYSKDWETLSASPARLVAPNMICFDTPPAFRPQVGATLTLRDIIRDQVGMLLYLSSDIVMENLSVRYMHGLGIVSQYTCNVTMERVTCAPSTESGRLLASSADFMHFSGCSGLVKVNECRFEGAQDDCINVHGTNLRAEECVSDSVLVLRFMHPQTYGFEAYFAGDTVAFIRPATMQRYATAVVKRVRQRSERLWEVTFDRAVPKTLRVGEDCVENLSCTPEVEITRSMFTRTSTRGILVTTPRRVVIADNSFVKTGMSAILIEGDARSWYESGAVKDVLITRNRFFDCGFWGAPSRAVIAVHPSNGVISGNKPVHRNVRVLDNTFELYGGAIFHAMNTEAICVENNVIFRHEQDPSVVNSDIVWMKCRREVIRNNISFNGASRSIQR